MWYTKKGDDGASKIFGASERNLKSGLIFEALGNVDELNSWLGFIFSFLTARINRSQRLKEEILEIQNDLFTVQAELARGGKHIPRDRVIWLEERISNYENNCPKPKGFVVPGTTRESSLFDVARTIARRTERSIVRVKDNNNIISPIMLSYLNRLSSYLYAIARYLAAYSRKKEHYPLYR